VFKGDELIDGIFLLFDINQQLESASLEPSSKKGRFYRKCGKMYYFSNMKVRPSQSRPLS
jgi:hypothetical protein